jgi:hypothetical protein
MDGSGRVAVTGQVSQAATWTLLGTSVNHSPTQCLGRTKVRMLQLGLAYELVIPLVIPVLHRQRTGPPPPRASVGTVKLAGSDTSSQTMPTCLLLCSMQLLGGQHVKTFQTPTGTPSTSLPCLRTSAYPRHTCKQACTCIATHPCSPLVLSFVSQELVNLDLQQPGQHLLETGSDPTGSSSGNVACRMTDTASVLTMKGGVLYRMLPCDCPMPKGSSHASPGSPRNMGFTRTGVFNGVPCHLSFPHVTGAHKHESTTHKRVLAATDKPRMHHSTCHVPVSCTGWP